MRTADVLFDWAPLPLGPAPTLIQPPEVEESRAAPRALLEAFLVGELRFIRLVRHGASYGAAFRRERPQGQRRPSGKERRVLELLVHGQCQKEIAYDLGVAVTTVSAHVKGAIERLGLPGWEQAVLVTALLERSRALPELPAAPGPAGGGVTPIVIVRADLSAAVLARLSPAEREVVLLMVDGRTNQEIAELRQSSPRTVANQIASAFRKVNAQRRLDLIRQLTAASVECSLATDAAAPGDSGGDAARLARPGWVAAAD